MFLIENSEMIESKIKLIPEKTAIPSRPPHLARPRLLGALAASLASCSATILSGRAGTGKTTLATDFAHTCRRPVAWYKVDASDFNQHVFLQYLASSVAQHKPGFGERTLASLGGQIELDPAAPAEAFVFELLECDSDPLVIVLEDLHLICEGDWLVPFLCRLLPLLPQNVHMLITSRSMPPAPLWRMRSKRTLEVIDEAALAFTRQEAVELFETHELSREQACVARDHAHGRAASLEACAVTLGKSQTNITRQPAACNQLPLLALEPS